MALGIRSAGRFQAHRYQIAGGQTHQGWRCQPGRMAQSGSRQWVQFLYAQLQAHRCHVQGSIGLCEKGCSAAVLTQQTCSSGAVPAHASSDI